MNTLRALPASQTRKHIARARAALDRACGLLQRKKLDRPHQITGDLR